MLRRLSAPARPRAAAARALRRTLPSLNPYNTATLQHVTSIRLRVMHRIRHRVILCPSLPAPACGATARRLPHTQPPCMAVRYRLAVQLTRPGLRPCCTRLHRSIATCRCRPCTGSGKRRCLTSYAAGGTISHHADKVNHGTLPAFVSGKAVELNIDASPRHRYQLRGIARGHQSAKHARHGPGLAGPTRWSSKALSHRRSAQTFIDSPRRPWAAS